ncbi:MAG: RND family transporter [Planctomycetaceae bacterium]
MTRLHFWSLVVAGLLLPVFIAAAIGIDMDAGRVTDWLPQGRPARTEYDRFVRQFGTDDYVILSWPGCTLDNPLVVKLAESLRAAAESGLIDKVASGPELLDELTAPPLRMTRDDALRRLEGVFVGPDHQTTCLSIRTTGPSADRKRAFNLICRTARNVGGWERSDLRVAGSTYEAVVLNEASSRTVEYYAVPAGLVSLLIAGLFLRQLRMTIAIFSVAAFSQLMAIGVLDVALGRMNVLLIVMPTLVYVLTMSGAVHLVNYCLEASRTRGLLHGVPPGMQAGRTPCVLAAVTTAIGMMSLCVSQIQPVREFGLYAAVSLMLSLGVLFFLLPAVLLWRIDGTNDAVRTRPSTFTRQVKSPMDVIAGRIIRHPARIATISLTAVLVCALGLAQLRSVVDFDRMFPADSEVVRNFAWLEEHLGPLVPIELLVDIPADSPLTDLERVELVGEIELAVSRLPDVIGTLSAATFVPRRPEEFDLADVIERRLRAKHITEHLPNFIKDGLLAGDGDVQRWRVTFRLPARGAWDYREMARNAVFAGQAVIEEQPEGCVEGVSVTSTGMMPVTDETNEQLFEDLARSYLMAFGLICPLMMLILRGVRAGLLAMLPNVTPTLMVFGLMGWCGVPVDIGTVLCASVALGIAVDDTVHFLTWFRRGLSEGLERTAAVRFAFDRCAIAMVQTTLICGSGMLVFGLSEFAPASRFAVMLAMLLVIALQGDLVLLPALLCSPLGRIFERPGDPQWTGPSTSAADALAVRRELHRG